MAEQNHNQANDELDRALDAALAKYVAVVPRAGLEERVLANLRIEQSREATHGWWRWTLAAALATVVVVAVALSWRSARPTQPVIANHPQTTTQGPREPERRAVNHDGNTVPSPRRGTIRRTVIHASRSSAAENPKLDQFPSPQPLSEQERALARYARDFPQEAGLIARMQEESEKEIQQRMTEAHSESSSYSDQEER
jgi:hypothetical protein